MNFSNISSLISLISSLLYPSLDGLSRFDYVNRNALFARTRRILWEGLRGTGREEVSDGWGLRGIFGGLRKEKRKGRKKMKVFSRYSMMIRLSFDSFAR